MVNAKGAILNNLPELCDTYLVFDANGRYNHAMILGVKKVEYLDSLINILLKY